MPGPNPEVEDIELLREVYLSPDPFVTATEIAERTDYTRQGIRYRFNKLVDSGCLNKRNVGSKAAVYWLTEEGERRVVKG